MPTNDVPGEAREQALDSLGWDSHFAVEFERYGGQDLIPARVAVEHKSAYDLYAECGTLEAQASGRLRHDSMRGEMPAVGDWVAVQRRDSRQATIHAVLPRRSKFSRKVAGFEIEEQVLAANVDVAFLVTSLDADLNIRRIERYMTTAMGSGADPVVVLTKPDLCDDPAAARAAVEAVAAGVPVHVVSGITGEGIDAIGHYFYPHRTATLLGSSGVGKSTLVNVLVGREMQRTNEVRWDGKGRHTTSHRQLIILPGGGLLIDTPGLRELQLWDAGPGLGETFEDIEELASECRFRDCAHEREPGCAVKAAIQSGALLPARLESYRKLQRELHHVAIKRDAQARSEQRKKFKAVNKSMRAKTKEIKARPR